MRKTPNTPQKLPAVLDYGAFAKELAEAQYSLGLLEGSHKNLPNPSLLIAPLTAKEAAVSSKIEGTQSTASDVFVYEAGGEPKYSDTIEVVNYRRTMVSALEAMEKGRPITAHFIKEMHESLLRDARHRGQIGEFRKGPVWIAERRGDPIEKAIYIPPEAVTVPAHMDNLLSFTNLEGEDSLVQAGVVHYQFEAIHPFEDGNGRIGRLLIPLLLYHRKKISSPIIYLSGYFESHREEYVDALHGVDETGQIEPWLKFFLKAVVEQAKETHKLISEINGLYDDLKTSFGSIKSPYAIRFLDLIFRQPVFTAPGAIAALKASRPTCLRLLKTLRQQHVVVGLKARRKRAKLYSFDKLLRILR